VMNFPIMVFLGLTNTTCRTISFFFSLSPVCAETGRVYAFGSNKFGELGLGHNISTTTPTSPEALKDSMYKVACGRYHSACIDCKENISCSLLIIRICRTILVCLFGWLVFFVCLLQNM